MQKVSIKKTWKSLTIFLFYGCTVMGGYMGRALVFVWDSAMRGVSGFRWFSPGIEEFLGFEGGLGTRF